MAMNADLVMAAKRITDMAAMAEQYRALARPLPRHSPARDDLFRQASAIDEEICSECTNLRRLAREPYGTAP